MEATFTSDQPTLDAATHYRADLGRGEVSRIVQRDACAVCGRTICVVTDTTVRASFVRLHMQCFKHAVPVTTPA